MTSIKLVKGANSASPAERLASLLDTADPKLSVQALSLLDFAHLALALGPESSSELLILASQKQFKTLLDIDAWDRDRVNLKRVHKWIDAMSQADNMGMAKGFLSLDPELAGFILLKEIKLYVEGEDQDPGEGHVLHPTPDPRVFVEIMLDGEEHERVLKMLDEIYSLNPAAAVRTLLSIRAALPSELEEQALQWRCARMEDLGFPPMEEALDVYAKPGSDHVAHYDPVEGSDLSYLPGFYADRLSPDELISRALDGMDGRQSTAITQQLVSLFNRILTADRIKLSDQRSTLKKIATALDTITLGLEVLGARDGETASRILLDQGVKEVFRFGYRQGAELAERARRLKRIGLLGGTEPGELHESPVPQVMSALLSSRPKFSRRLDEPAVTGIRPFKTLYDVERTKQILDQAEAAALLVHRVIGFSGKAIRSMAEETGKAPSLANAFRTAFVRRAIGFETFDLEILEVSQVNEFRKACISMESGRPEMNQKTAAWMESSLDSLKMPLPEELQEHVSRLAGKWITDLLEELGSIPNNMELDPRYIGLLFVA
ncbi:MAG: hypothetical protein GXP49_10160 [Deltaproteobacteria bacterium]|nr:hypothetical protein [Deltaproteobacteria bacterium]